MVFVSNIVPSLSSRTTAATSSSSSSTSQMSKYPPSPTAPSLASVPTSASSQLAPPSSSTSSSVVRVPWQGPAWGIAAATVAKLDTDPSDVLEDKLLGKSEQQNVMLAVEAALQKQVLTRINVGGQIFTTTMNTLAKYPNSTLNQHYYDFPRDSEGNIFLDRSGDAFGIILDYIRTNNLIPTARVSLQQLLEELKFYRLPFPDSIGYKLRNETLEYLTNTNGAHYEGVLTKIVDELSRRCHAGRSHISVAYFSKPYTLVDFEPSVIASFQEIFDLASVDDAVFQCLCSLDGRHYIQTKLRKNEIYCKSGYYPGSIYGPVCPIHVWFVVSTIEDFIDEAVQNLEFAKEKWQHANKKLLK